MFIRHLTTVKTQAFRETGKELSTRDREKLVIFGKLSMNFWKRFGKKIKMTITFLADFFLNFLSARTSRKFFDNDPGIFRRF